ncbi:helix-turn-helix domain-containing protein [Desulfosporosinus sp. SB140]|uniref:helix-turn-helix domain-containing protein n=1 Tax=Desulfosporosinus paludis TaxID=3115649 RepID=UPI00388D7EB4
MEIDYKELGERIAKRRKMLNLTQDDVAEVTGLSNNYISNIENNHSIPSIETLVKICNALDITPDYLLLGIVRDTDVNLHSQINQKIKLCDTKKLELVDHFITWLVKRLMPF